VALDPASREAIGKAAMEQRPSFGWWETPCEAKDHFTGDEVWCPKSRQSVILPRAKSREGPEAVNPTGSPLVLSGFCRYPYRLRLSARNGWPLACFNERSQSRESSLSPDHGCRSQNALLASSSGLGQLKRKEFPAPKLALSTEVPKGQMAKI
jgi:hypothetical protein